MSFDEPHRIRFHTWLVEHGLPVETANAILRSMTPYDWHRLATKDDLVALFERIDARFDGIDARFDGIDARFDGIDARFDGVDARLAGLEARFDGTHGRLAGLEAQFADMRGEMAGIRSDVRTVLLALVGFMLTVVLATAGIGFGLYLG